MKKEINVITNKQYWDIKNALEADGYKKVAEAYWTAMAVTFQKDDIQVIVNHK